MSVNPEPNPSVISAEQRERMLVSVTDPLATFLMTASVSEGSKPFLSFGGTLQPDVAMSFAVSIFVNLLGHNPGLTVHGINAIAVAMKQKESKIVKPLVVMPGGMGRN